LEQGRELWLSLRRAFGPFRLGRPSGWLLLLLLLQEGAGAGAEEVLFVC